MVGIEKPILLDIPESFETERLIIRAPRAGDGHIVHEAILETLEELKPWLSWTNRVRTVEDTETLLRWGAAGWMQRQDFRMFLFRKSDGLFVGASSLHNANWSIPSFEIGYWVRKSQAGQGYVSEAVAGITDFAFRTIGAERVEIRCDRLNERSAAVARRAGYTLEGKLRQNALSADETEVRDTVIFSMTREEFLNRRGAENAEKRPRG